MACAPHSFPQRSIGRCCNSESNRDMVCDRTPIGIHTSLSTRASETIPSLLDSNPNYSSRLCGYLKASCAPGLITEHPLSKWSVCVPQILATFGRIFKTYLPHPSERADDAIDVRPSVDNVLEDASVSLAIFCQLQHRSPDYARVGSSRLWHMSHGSRRRSHLLYDVMFSPTAGYMANPRSI